MKTGGMGIYYASASVPARDEMLVFDGIYYECEAFIVKDSKEDSISSEAGLIQGRGAPPYYMYGKRLLTQYGTNRQADIEDFI